MRVTKADGKLKGYDAMRKCSNLTMPTTRYSAALLNRPHPSNSSIYFVGTDEGVVHKCSYNYLNRHLDLFLAHEGPIIEMKFSPFSEIIFATCGDDWHTRIWAEGISEPLLDFYVMMQSVQGLDWSPTHSTILVTIQGNDIHVWDLQRKVYCPQSVTKSPTQSRNTVVQFTESGKSLVVGDVNGNVNVFAFEDMPFPAYFQENLLFDSLYRALITNPSLLNKVRLLRKQSE